MGPLSKVTAVAVAISGRLLSFYDCQKFSFFENLNFLIWDERLGTLVLSMMDMKWPLVIRWSELEWVRRVD